jgi:hypothetical protein
MGKLKPNDKVYVISKSEYAVVQNQIVDHSGGGMEIYRVRLDSGLYIVSLGRNLNKVNNG